MKDSKIILFLHYMIQNQTRQMACVDPDLPRRESDRHVSARTWPDAPVARVHRKRLLDLVDVEHESRCDFGIINELDSLLSFGILVRAHHDQSRSGRRDCRSYIIHYPRQTIKRSKGRSFVENISGDYSTNLFPRNSKTRRKQDESVPEVFNLFRDSGLRFYFQISRVSILFSVFVTNER